MGLKFLIGPGCQSPFGFSSLPSARGSQRGGGSTITARSGEVGAGLGGGSGGCCLLRGLQASPPAGRGKEKEKKVVVISGEVAGRF